MDAHVPTRRSARKPKGAGHLRRAEILKAAEEIFVAEGYERATIRRIGEAVGVSSTTLYLHFDDKSRILLEICKEALRDLLARNAEIAARGGDPAQRVRSMAAAYILWGLANPNAYQLVYLAPRPASAGDWPDETVDLSVQGYRAFAAVVREIADAGRLRAGSVRAASQAIWMAAHGVTSLLITRPTMGWAEQGDLIAVTLNSLLDGLIAP